jgi:hypothetical protein
MDQNREFLGSVDLGVGEARVDLLELVLGRPGVEDDVGVVLEIGYRRGFRGILERLGRAGGTMGRRAVDGTRGDES